MWQTQQQAPSPPPPFIGNMAPQPHQQQHQQLQQQQLQSTSRIAAMRPPHQFPKQVPPCEMMYQPRMRPQYQQNRTQQQQNIQQLQLSRSQQFQNIPPLNRPQQQQNVPPQQLNRPQQHQNVPQQQLTRPRQNQNVPQQQQQNRPQPQQNRPQLQQNRSQQQQPVALQPVQQNDVIAAGLEMMEAATYSSNPRAARNLAEKQRRDNLNTQIATMASLVPTLQNGGARKKDKISILRLTAAHLRLAYTLGIAPAEFLPRRFNDIDLESWMIDILHGWTHFLIVLTTGGKVVYVSRHVEEHLGHESHELTGDSLYKYVFPDDHEALTMNLTPDRSCFEPANSDSLEEGSNSSDDSGNVAEYLSFKPQRRTFCVRMSVRPNSRKECPYYQSVLMSGVLKLAHEFANTILTNAQKRKEFRSTSNDVVFVGTGRVLQTKKIAELSLLEANKDEYFTRHLVDGRIIFCDHRISIVAGYMSEEVSGTSAFKFMHKDDVRWTIVALKHMYDQGNYGSSCYRLVTKTGEYIYLRTHGYLEYDETTQSVSSFICVNTLLSEEEGKKLTADMKSRFAAITAESVARIENEVLGSTTDDNASIDGEDDIHYAINRIIGDLPSPLKVDERRSITPLPDNQVYKAAVYSKQLPPASIQANIVGIKNIDNLTGKGKGGKGGKGKSSASGKNIDEHSSSSTSSHKSNGERTYFAEKKMPKMDDSLSPASTRTITPIPETPFPLPPTETETYPELTRTNEVVEFPQKSTNNFTACSGSSDNSLSFDVQTNIASSLQSRSSAQTNLKRSYENEDGEHMVYHKKKTTDNFVSNQDLLNVDKDMPCTSGDVLPTYLEVPPTISNPNVEVIETNVQSLESVEPEFIDFSDLQPVQPLNTDFEQNEDILKFLSTLPPTLIEDPTQGNIEPTQQYSISDHDIAVVKKQRRPARSQMIDSTSSCEPTQYNDTDVTRIQVQRDNLVQAHSEENAEKQNFESLQLNVQHDKRILNE